MRLILHTIVASYLVVLPLYASDFPSDDKCGYFRLLQEWPTRVPIVAEHLRRLIAKDSVTGRVPASQFMQKAKEFRIFDGNSIVALSKQLATE